MRIPIRAFIGALAAAAIAVILVYAASPLAGQAPGGAAYRAPRAADGKPDLNGIWQALNEANYDIQMHMARSAMAVRPRSAAAGEYRGADVIGLDWSSRN